MAPEDSIPSNAEVLQKVEGLLGMAGLSLSQLASALKPLLVPSEPEMVSAMEKALTNLKVPEMLKAQVEAGLQAVVPVEKVASNGATPSQMHLEGTPAAPEATQAETVAPQGPNLITLATELLKAFKGGGAADPTSSMDTMLGFMDKFMNLSNTLAQRELTKYEYAGRWVTEMMQGAVKVGGDPTKVSFPTLTGPTASMPVESPKPLADVDIDRIRSNAGAPA